jgi:hypothetical protein
MTTPDPPGGGPPQEPPPGGWPPPDAPQGEWQPQSQGGRPPQGHPYYPQYPPYPPYPMPARRESSTGTVVGLAVAGAFGYFLVNFITVFLVMILAAESGSSRTVIAAGAIGLAVLAFGGGGGLLAVRKPWAKGLGLGLMIGWALMSIVSVGFCTGINPTIYGSA